MKKAVGASLGHLTVQAREGTTDHCEAAAKRIADSLKSPKFPTEFTREVREAMDALLLHTFMKATAAASKAAIEAGQADDGELRTRKIKEAREKLAGAMKYKPPTEFKVKCEKMLEVAVLSGGMKAKGPTRAKPADTTAKPENQAKISDEDYAKTEEEQAAATLARTEALARTAALARTEALR
ncbi:MAG: hypothetical protein O2985_05470 [Proteobacteria bacterium]|nr:hypothetical protein [Pseudomonadota bacterium]